MNLGFIKFFDDNFTDFISIGGESIITMYAVFLSIGILLAILFAFKQGKRFGIAKTHIVNGAIICLPLSLFMGRLVYCLFHHEEITEFTLGIDTFVALIDIQDGINALSVLLTAVIFLVVYSKWKKISTFKLFDIVIPSILIIQILSRFGSLFGGGILGAETTSEFLNMFMLDFFVEKCYAITDTMTGASAYFHPVFYYEGIWLLLGLVLCIVSRQIRVKVQFGDYIGLYLIWFGLGNGLIVELAKSNVAGVVISILMVAAGIGFIVFKHMKMSEKVYFEAINEISEKSLQCYVFDLDQTIIKADNLVNVAYGETLTKNHGLTVYDDPQVALDSARLKRYVQFTKEHHELLTEMYRGVKVTFETIKSAKNEIIIISKLPAELIALKIHHYNLNKYVDRFINSNDIAKLGQQYNPFSIMVLSSDRKILNFSTRNGFKTAYAKFANEDTTGVVCDEVLNRFADAEYLV